MPEKRWVNAEEFLRNTSDDDSDFFEPEDTVDREELKDVLTRYLELLTPEWHKKAACVGMDDSIFFGNKDIEVRPALTVSEIRYAKSICLSCEAISDCFNHAITSRERYGIWAGISGRTRARIFALIDSGQITEKEILKEFKDGKIDKYEKVKTSIVDIYDEEE